MGKFATLFEAQVEEGLRKIGQYEHGNKKATVHRDAEWGEYRVKHHVDGKHQGEGSDYHTDDKEEAHHYAKRWAEGHFDKKNESAEDRESRSEYSTHDRLQNSVHHVYVATRGKKKSIAGPFRSKEEAESHPARKFGDGVATSDQIHH